MSPSGRSKTARTTINDLGEASKTSNTKLMTVRMKIRVPDVMLLLLVPLSALFAVGAVGCKNDVTEICGLAGALPKVSSGRGSATRSDGVEFNETASWSAGTAGSLTIGVLDMLIANEETGLATDTIIEDGAFPICVRLGARSDKIGSGNYIDGGYVTDATHTGAIAILANDTELVGRFEVSLAAGGDALSFSQGVFSAKKR